MSSPLSTDRAWLRAHHETNFRIRKPVEGELEELMRRSGAIGAFATAMDLPVPDLQNIRVVVAEPTPGILMRAIVLQPDENICWTFAIALGKRLVFDRSGA